MYLKKSGIFTPFSSAMDFTMKLGPLPMYVIAPKKTAPTEMAFNKDAGMPATMLSALIFKPVATL